MNDISEKFVDIVEQTILQANEKQQNRYENPDTFECDFIHPDIKKSTIATTLPITKQRTQQRTEQSEPLKPQQKPNQPQKRPHSFIAFGTSTNLPPHSLPRSLPKITNPIRTFTPHSPQKKSTLTSPARPLSYPLSPARSRTSPNRPPPFYNVQLTNGPIFFEKDYFTTCISETVFYGKY